MSDQKLPWPSLWNLWRCWQYNNGLTNDRSGWDTINAWGLTATPEEMAKLEKQGYWLGFFAGMGLGYFAVNAIFRVFFGDHDRDSFKNN